MKPARFHPEAEAELLDAIWHYEGEKSGLGGDLQDRVEAAVRLVEQSPQLFAAQPMDALRECPVRRFPYTVYYLELDTEIWIAAVAHQKRRPGYWAGRSPF